MRKIKIQGTLFAPTSKGLFGRQAGKSFAGCGLTVVSKVLRKRSVRYGLLAAVSAAGFGLRAYRLGKWGFWRDEMFTVGDQEDGFNYTPLRQSTSQYLVRRIVRSRGIDEFSARLVPALVGALTVPLLYPFLTRIFSPRVALLASTLLALSPWHLYWSQNARFYTLLLLFYSLALFTFYLGLEEDNLLLLISSLLFLGLAARERLFALFFVPVVAAYLGILLLPGYPRPRGLNVRNLLLFLLPGGIGAWLFARPYLQDLPGWMEGFGRSNNNPLWLAGVFAYYLGLPVVFSAVAGAVYGFLRQDRALLFMSCGAFIPLGILISIAPVHYTASRYGFVTLGSWLALASYGLITLSHALLQRDRPFAAAGVLALPFLQFLFDDIRYFSHNGKRANWKEAFAVIGDRLQPNDRVFSTGPDLADHYLKNQTNHLDDLELAESPERDTRSWIVEDTDAAEKYPELGDWLAQHALHVASFDVIVWLRNFKMRVYLVTA